MTPRQALSVREAVRTMLGETRKIILRGRPFYFNCKIILQNIPHVRSRIITNSLTQLGLPMSNHHGVGLHGQAS